MSQYKHLSESDLHQIAKACNATFEGAFTLNDTGKETVELKSEKKVIGGVSLDKVNKFQGTAGGGIWINAKYHGQGYGAEAFSKRINFAFNELKLRRLENGFFDGNPSSFKMQEKFGYKIEGMRRKVFICMADGEIKDEYITSLLKDEWITK